MDYAVIYNDLKALLAGVSEKIGEGAGYAWEIVVHQQVAIGISKLIWASLFLIPIVCLILLIFAAYKQASKKTEADEAEGWVVLMIILTGAISGLLIWMFSFLSEGVMYIINPQYYAIEFFINAVKSGSLPQ